MLDGLLTRYQGSPFRLLDYLPTSLTSTPGHVTPTTLYQPGHGPPFHTPQYDTHPSVRAARGSTLRISTTSHRSVTTFRDFVSTDQKSVPTPLSPTCLPTFRNSTTSHRGVTTLRDSVSTGAHWSIYITPSTTGQQESASTLPNKSRGQRNNASTIPLGSSNHCFRMNQWTKERDLCFFCSDFDFQQTYSRPPYNHCPTDWRRNLHYIATLPVPPYNHSKRSNSRMQHSAVTPF